MNASKYATPRTPLAHATIPEGNGIYLRNIPMVPKIVMAKMRDNFALFSFPIILSSQFHLLL